MHPEQIRIFRAMSPAKKLEIAHALYLMARQLKEAGIRMAHPEWTDEQVKRKLREYFVHAAAEG